MSEPVRLSKSQSMQENNWESTLQRYAPYLLIVCFIILTLLIFALVFTVMGVSANTLTGNEGNAYYYHMKDVI
ncbi:MAG: hypothetical protein IKF79_01660 [Methanosphaera sp.]|nr:hypothetical protein [Methanosphaera sp.]